MAENRPLILKLSPEKVSASVFVPAPDIEVANAVVDEDEDGHSKDHVLQA